MAVVVCLSSYDNNQLTHKPVENESMCQAILSNIKGSSRAAGSLEGPVLRSAIILGSMPRNGTFLAFLTT